MATIGDRIRECREVLGLNQSGLARSLGTNQPLVSRWERNKTKPSPNYLYKLAERLSVDPLWILFGK